MLANILLLTSANEITSSEIIWTYFSERIDVYPRVSSKSGLSECHIRSREQPLEFSHSLYYYNACAYTLYIKS